MPKPALCLKIPKSRGEKTIALVGKLGLFEKSLKIKRDEQSLFVPLIRQPNEAESEWLKSEVPDYQFLTCTFEEKPVQAETLVQILRNKVPPQLQPELPQALDMVGDIAIVEIPKDLELYQSAIGEAIIQMHKNVRTVLAKAGAVSGAYRVRELKFIAGENKTQTVHKEFGCVYYVDVAKAYFSPRLSQEHERVASLVHGDETVVDLFAGIGPFSVLIAKRNPTVKVYAVDLNPDAFALLKLNVRVNRVENRVFPILGDARQVSSGKLKGCADRVIMNLPETAIHQVDAACQALKAEGGVVHFYAFVRAPDSIDALKERFRKAVEKCGGKVDAFLAARSIRETAPYESQVVLDAKIS